MSFYCRKSSRHRVRALGGNTSDTAAKTLCTLRFKHSPETQSRQEITKIKHAHAELVITGQILVYLHMKDAQAERHKHREIVRMTQIDLKAYTCECPVKKNGRYYQGMV